MEKSNVLIYGLGRFYFLNEREINNKYNIMAFIDREKKGCHVGKKVIFVDSIAQYNYDKIIIMIQNIQECINISKQLLVKGVDAEKIILGCSLFGEYSKSIDKIDVLPEGKLALKFGDILVKVKSNDEFNNVCEVFLNQTYNYFINNGKRDIVLDVGMNIGDATLYFTFLDNVEKVYGYEPFRETFLAAEENLKDYCMTGKVNILNYGISNENETRTIGYNGDMSCGQSTINDVREKAYATYLNWGLVNASNEQMEQISVKKASEVFKPIFKKYPNHNIVLKMDCEGEEYVILEELLQNGILGKFSFIMLEWHYGGKEPILRCLEGAGMSWWCNDKNEEMGLVYAYSR